MSSLTPQPKMSAAEKMKGLNKIIGAINSKAGKNMVNFASDPDTMKKLTIDYIPFPSLRLNAMCSGIPKGRVSIVAGMPDSGKTSLILESIGIAMKKDPDFIAFWLESEKSLELTALRDMFGIDLSRFIYMEVEREGAAEKALDILEAAVTAGGIDIAVINSLKCLTPSKEFEDSMADQNIGLQARLNSKFMRKIVPHIAEHETALCMTQHLSTQIGVMHGDPMTISGGFAIRFASMLTLDLRRKTLQKDDPITKEEGSKIGVHVMKNHCNQTRYPYLRGDYYVKFGEGTQVFTEIIELSIENGTLTKGGGGWISETDPNTGEPKTLADGTLAKWHGMNKTKDYLTLNPSYYEYLKSIVMGEEIQLETMSDEDVSLAEAFTSVDAEEEAKLEALLEEGKSEIKKRKPASNKKKTAKA